MYSFVIQSEIQCWPELSDESVLNIRIPVSVLGNKDNSSDAKTPKKSASTPYMRESPVTMSYKTCELKHETAKYKL